MVHLEETLVRLLEEEFPPLEEVMALELERALYDLTPDLEHETYIQNQEHVQEVLLLNRERVLEITIQNPEQERVHEPKHLLLPGLEQDLHLPEVAVDREVLQEVAEVKGKEVK